MNVSWEFTGDSRVFKVTGRSGEGLAGPATLGLKEGRIPGVWGEAEDGEWAGSPRTHSTRWLVVSAAWALGGVQG